MFRFLLILTILLTNHEVSYANTFESTKIMNTWLSNEISIQVISQSLTLDFYAVCMPLVVAARVVEIQDKPFEGSYEKFFDSIEALTAAYRKIQISRGMNESVFTNSSKPYLQILKSIGEVEYAAKYSNFCGTEASTVFNKIIRATSNK